jgi:hypothetical protein
MVTSELRTATGRPDLTLPPGACDTRPCRMLLRPPRDLVGLALSGGGNRSATFNLGMLQGLHDLKLLPAFDYLATVSGGGYVGGFWSAWRARRPRGRAFPGGGTYEGRAEAPEIRHLRQFSNFLSPRVSVLSWDTGRMIASAVSGLVPAFAAALSLVVLALAAWLYAAWRLAAGATGAGPLGAAVGAAALLVPLLALTEWSWRRREPDRAAAGAYVFSAAGGALAGGLAWTLVTRHWLTIYPARTIPWGVPPADPALVVGGVVVDAALVVAPAAACAIAAATIALVRMLFSTRRPITARVRDVRSAAERVLARLLLGGALWAALGAVWLGGAALADAAASAGAGSAAPAGAAGALALLATLFTRVLRVMSLLPKGGADGSRARRLAPLAPQVLAYVIIGGVAVLAASALVAAHRAAPFDLAALHRGLALPAPCAAYAAAVLVVLATLRFFDPNTVGLHAFYRARLARAYLGASNERAGREYARCREGDPDCAPGDAGGRQSDEQDDDDVPLAALAAQRPVHLVCCAANDLAPRDPVANLRRGARSAVLSPHGFGVGDAAAEWRGAAARDAAPDVRADLRGPLPSETLGTAMTASAAAFNSQMGIQSVRLGPAVTFLLSALNLRLGLWLPHPDARRRAASALLRQPGAGSSASSSGARAPRARACTSPTARTSRTSPSTSSCAASAATSSSRLRRRPDGGVRRLRHPRAPRAAGLRRRDRHRPRAAAPRARRPRRAAHGRRRRALPHRRRGRPAVREADPRRQRAARRRRSTARATRPSRTRAPATSSTTRRSGSRTAVSGRTPRWPPSPTSSGSSAPTPTRRPSRRTRPRPACSRARGSCGSRCPPASPSARRRWPSAARGSTRRCTPRPSPTTPAPRRRGRSCAASSGSSARSPTPPTPRWASSSAPSRSCARRCSRWRRRSTSSPSPAAGTRSTWARSTTSRAGPTCRPRASGGRCCGRCTRRRSWPTPSGSSGSAGRAG